MLKPVIFSTFSLIGVSLMINKFVFQTVETGVKTAVGMSLVPIKGAMVLAGSYLLK